MRTDVPAGSRERLSELAEVNSRGLSPELDEPHLPLARLIGLAPCRNATA